MTSLDHQRAFPATVILRPLRVEKRSKSPKFEQRLPPLVAVRSDTRPTAAVGQERLLETLV